MGLEIERKYLIIGKEYKKSATKSLYKQGYIVNTIEKVVRIRIHDNDGFITIKGKTNNFSKAEYEYQIPFDEANKLLATLCEKPLIEKYRYTVYFEGNKWEIDEFLGDNNGLVIAEIELQDENTTFTKPEWIGEEVSLDPRYFNSNLVKMPFSKW